MSKLGEGLFLKAPIKKFSSGEVVLHEGERTNRVFKVNKGYIKKYNISGDGSKNTMLILGAGDIFPLIKTFDKLDPLDYYYEAFGETEVGWLRRTELKMKFADGGKYAEWLLKHFADRAKSLTSRLAVLNSANSQEKVIQVLIYLANRHGQKEGKFKKLPSEITHEDIAELAGLTRETTTLKLNDLPAGSFKYTDGSYVVDEIKLSKLLE